MRWDSGGARATSIVSSGERMGEEPGSPKRSSVCLSPGITCLELGLPLTQGLSHLGLRQMDPSITQWPTVSVSPSVAATTSNEQTRVL